MLETETQERLILHLPETFNDGRLVSVERLQAYEEELLEIAGGFTLVSATGTWRSPLGQSYREPVRLYEIDVPNEQARERLLALAHRIALELDQEAVYVTSAPVRSWLVFPGGVGTGQTGVASSAQANREELHVR
jgi:hypothetical protein